MKVGASQVAQSIKNLSAVQRRLPAKQETRVRSLGQEDPLAKEMATHSSILAWRIPWTEETGRLQSTGSQSRTWLRDFHFQVQGIQWEKELGKMPIEAFQTFTKYQALTFQVWMEKLAKRKVNSQCAESSDKTVKQRILQDPKRSAAKPSSWKIFLLIQKLAAGLWRVC